MSSRRYYYQLYGRMKIIKEGMKMVNIVGGLPKADWE